MFDDLTKLIIKILLHIINKKRTPTQLIVIVSVIIVVFIISHYIKRPTVPTDSIGKGVDNQSRYFIMKMSEI